MKPEQLLDDPHLTATGGLADIRLTDGERAGQPVKATLFPFTLDGQRPGVRLNPPKRGEHTREVLAAIGIAEREIDALVETKAVA
jgi:crotonobetainyl-CoA:carnitine CoA-transferase CaiB-like acyl-CoA transferase